MKTYYDGVLWYRDYWPNRYRKLQCRRKLARIPEMVKKPSQINKNLTVQQGRDNRCILKDGNTTYDLLNPTDLINKFEPWSMKPLSDNEWIPEMPYSKLSLQRNRKLKIQLIFALTVAVASFVYYFYLDNNPVALLGNGLLILLVWYGFSAIPVETRLWIYLYDEDRSTTFFEVKNTPPWLTKKKYYVFRFLYKFPFEWTFNRYQLIRSLKTRSISFDSIMKIPDWERVELWVGAEDGIVEWIVSDYHYKELWYHYGKTETPICIKFHGNFHTPEPILGVDNIKNGLKVGFDTDWEEYKDTVKKYHKSMKYGKFFSKIDQAILFKGFMNSLPWTHIRYPYGADSNVYIDNSLGAHEMAM